MMGCHGGNPGTSLDGNISRQKILIVPEGKDMWNVHIA